MSATDRFQEPDLDPRWGKPTVTVTRYTIINDRDELEDALNGFKPTFATPEEADAELDSWDSFLQLESRVVKITATVSEVEP